MPIYEYCCKNCNNVFEEWLKEFEVNTMPCPNCQADGERMISIPTFILKGGGWYATEYGNQSGREERVGAPEQESGSAASSPAKDSEAPFSGTLEKKERPPQSAPAASSAPANK
jgi:putative FmdB family regulatory protein